MDQQEKYLQQLDSCFAQILSNPVVDFATIARKRRIASRIKFHHMIEVGDRVHISYRRAKGVIEELVIHTKDAAVPDSSCYGKFRVRLDSGERIEEHPEHLCKIESIKA